MTILKPKLLTITGPTACGKSTVGQMLARHYGYDFIEEEWATNPHLADFNAGRGGFADAETWFITSDIGRYQRALALLKEGRGVVLDKPFFENHSYVDIAPLQPEEREMFHGWIDEVTKSLPPPDLMLDIRATPDLSLGRIASRGRREEQPLTGGWFEGFARAHHESVTRFPDVSRLDISADRHDFLHDPREFMKLTRVIDRKLRG